MLRRYAWNQLRRPRPLPLCRFQSSGKTPWRQDTTPEPSVFIEENFAKHTLFVLDVGKRVIKFSLIGLALLAATTATVWEGTHLWVEFVELSPETDDEVKKWEWDAEAEKWSGDPAKGGTDAGLGFKGRHTLRAAWMAHNWGVGYSTAVMGADTGEGLIGPGGLKVIDARMQRTEDFLRTAISIAEKRQLSTQTISELLARHASILERLGAQSLPESKAQYLRAWSSSSEKSIGAARIALKLGDINSRLGQGSDAIRWWSKAIEIARGVTSTELTDVLPEISGSAPSSPAAQRLLSTALVSLSAFYAQSGQLQKAEAVEEATLGMLRSIRPPESLAAASPPQALHALYLLQRSSLLSIHLAEVLHAQQKSLITSIQWLTSAAESSERVARALTGLPSSQIVGVTDSVTPPQYKVPLPTFTSSRSMEKVAHGLLRDARRTSAEAWNLIGMLNETQGKNLAAALQCYERAVEWAGIPTGDSNVMKAAESTLESDWVVFWGNYTRAKRLVDQAIS